MKNITLKRFLKLGWSANWTQKEDKAHKAGYLLGVQAGMKQAREQQNARRRMNRLAKKLTQG